MTAAAPVASPAPPQVLLAHHLGQLKLPTFVRRRELHDEATLIVKRIL
jgi:hypothetical protein